MVIGDNMVLVSREQGATWTFRALGVGNGKGIHRTPS